MSSLEDELRRIIRPSEIALLLDWIEQQPAYPVRMGKSGETERDLFLMVAVDLAKAGFTVRQMTDYALKQIVKELFLRDPCYVGLLDVVRAYTAVHNMGPCLGPATRMAVEAVRDAYR